MKLNRMLLMVLMGIALFRSVAWFEEKHALAADPQGDLSAKIDVLESTSAASAPVILDGKVLFRVRGIASFPAESRAAVIAERIKALARNPRFKTEALRFVETEPFTDIMGGDIQIVRMFDADAQIEGAKRSVLVPIYLDRIREVIKEYRQERSAEKLLNNALYAAGATLILAVVIILLVKVGRRIDTFLERRYKRGIHSLEIKSIEIVRGDRIWGTFHGLVKALRAFIIVVLAYAYLNFVLNLFPWTRQAGKQMVGYVVGTVTTMGNAILDYIPALVFLIILGIIVRYVLKALHSILDSISRGSVTLSGFDREWAQPTYKIVRFIVLAFAVVVAYPYIPGSSSEAFKGVSIFVGVLFSLGSSSIISNVIAGYTMTYRRAFKVGDRVKINEALGDVTEMRNLVTHLRSLKNEEIIIPNSIILNGQVINYSSLARKEGLILHTTVGIGYEVPWRQVEAMLHLAAERTQEVLKDPRPFVLQQALGDFCVTYELNVFCDDPRRMTSIYSALHRNILDLFNEYGVQIMTPSYESDPEKPKLVAKEEWFAAPAKPGDGGSG